MKLWKSITVGAVLVGAVACSGAEKPEEDVTNNGTSSGSNNGTTDENNATAGAAQYIGLHINEVAASGDPNDWFELYNSGDTVVFLDGLTFTDDPAVPNQAGFIDGMIEPGEFFLVEVSDETYGFKLGGDEELHLFAPNGEEIDSVDWDEGASPAGKSFGLFPDGEGDFKTLNTPTPGASNLDNDPGAPVCGDGVLEGEEVCDETEFDGVTCETEGFTGGSLTCEPGCAAISTSGCEAAGGSVVINEVTSSGDDNIELYNGSGAAVSLEGWYIVDDGWDPANPDPDHRYDFESGTEIADGGFLELIKDTHHVFGVGGADTITLYDDTDGVVDQTTWPDGGAETSWCRATDGDGDFAACSTATFGASNE